MALDDSTWKRYAIAGLAPLAALVVHAGVEAALGIDIQPLLILAIGFIVPAQLAGLGPGLVATGLLALLAAFFLLDPPYSLAIANTADQLRLAVFSSVGLVVSLLGGSLRRWRHQSRNERRARRVAEQAQLDAQRTAAERLRMIVDTAYDAFVAFDRDRRITDWNPQAEETFGWPREEALGKPLLETLIAESHRPMLLDEIEHYLSSGGQWTLRRRFELSALHRDGREFPVEMTMSPVSSGEKLFFASFIHDITERRRTQQELTEHRKELERSNEELQQFAYVASHDLQEPLRMVASYTQLLARRYKDKLGRDADEFIHYAVDGAQRMQTLINDLLAYSRVGTRGKPFEPVDLGEVLEIVKVNLKVAIEETGAQLVVAPLPTVHGDRSQLVQLFQNLIGNAIKFRGDAPPRVEISAERDEPAAAAAGAWRFAVRDNGIGIDPEHYDRIFVIFQRLHTREHYEGTGIGLAVCRKIVERHGGKIRVESAEGKGSVFSFTIADMEAPPS